MRGAGPLDADPPRSAALGACGSPGHCQSALHVRSSVEAATGCTHQLDHVAILVMTAAGIYTSVIPPGEDHRLRLLALPWAGALAYMRYSGGLAAYPIRPSHGEVAKRGVVPWDNRDAKLRSCFPGISREQYIVEADGNRWWG